MWRCKQIVSYIAAVSNEGGGREASKGEDSPFSVSTFMEKDKETAMERMRNVEAVVETEETGLEDKSKGVAGVGFKRALTL